jgi:hypothetical protein
MTYNQEAEIKSRSSMLVVRVDKDQKRLVEDAAQREGLQISSFFMMLLVRANILPSSCLRKIKRRPVPFFNVLHQLLGTINKIGGNCKQMDDALPHTTGLRSTHDFVNHAAEAVIDAIQGKAIPANVNLAKFEGELTDQGYAFNAIVRSVNMGKPQLAGLPAVLKNISQTANAITLALGNDYSAGNNLVSEPTGEIRARMKKSAKASTKRQGDV